MEQKCCDTCEENKDVWDMEYLATQDIWICNTCLESN